jgi:hypothetical protein
MDDAQLEEIPILSGHVIYQHTTGHHDHEILHISQALVLDQMSIYPRSSSILILHFGPNSTTSQSVVIDTQGNQSDILLIAQMTEALDSAQSPKIVNSHPSPIPAMIGAATIPPTQLKIFRKKLLSATPEDAR